MRPSFGQRCTWLKSSILVSSDHSTMFQSYFQRLANSRHLNLLVVLSFLRGTLPKSLLVWRWHLMVDCETLFLNCGPWVLLCLPHHLPQCAWGQHALASSSWQVCNCSRCLKLFDYCTVVSVCLNVYGGFFYSLSDLCRSTTI